MSYILTQYNNSYFRLTYKKDNNKKIKSKIFSSKFSTNSTNDIMAFSNLSRTKNTIKKIALGNDWEYFATWTINSVNCDRFSLSNCQEKMKKLIKAYKRKFKDFKFLYITEKHKNGAFHFHGLVSGLGDLYVNNNGYLSSKHFEKLGFNSFSKIKDINKCGNYIMKYITKECVKNEMGSIYFCSRGLGRGCSYFVDIPQPDKIFTKEKCYTNDFLMCRDIDVNSCDKETLLAMQDIQDIKYYLFDFLS